MLWSFWGFGSWERATFGDRLVCMARCDWLVLTPLGEMGQHFCWRPRLSLLRQASARLLSVACDRAIARKAPRKQTQQPRRRETASGRTGLMASRHGSASRSLQLQRPSGALGDSQVFDNVIMVLLSLLRRPLSGPQAAAAPRAPGRSM